MHRISCGLGGAGLGAIGGASTYACARGTLPLERPKNVATRRSNTDDLVIKGQDKWESRDYNDTAIVRPRLHSLLRGRHRSLGTNGAPRSPFCRLPNEPPWSSVSTTTVFINEGAIGGERQKVSTSLVPPLQTSHATGYSR